MERPEKDELELDWLRHDTTIKKRKEMADATGGLLLNLLSACRDSEDPKVARAVALFDANVDAVALLGGTVKWAQ